MNRLVKDVWRGLVQRRLWPLAVLLLAALAAVPVVLARDPEQVATAPVAPATATATDGTDLQTMVSAGSDSERSQRRRVIGARKNPFKPAASPKKADTPTASGQTAATTSGSAPVTAADTTSSAAATGGTTTDATVSQPAQPQPTTTTPDTTTPHKRYVAYSADVRFGTIDTTPRPDVQTLQRLDVLPNAKKPVALFLGVLKDRQTAVFLIDASARAEGDGTCKPSKGECQRVLLRKGQAEQIETLDATDGSVTTYKLKLVGIRRSVLEEVSATVSSAGHRSVSLTDWIDQATPFGYDEATGLLARLTQKALAEKLAAVADAAGL